MPIRTVAAIAFATLLSLSTVAASEPTSGESGAKNADDRVERIDDVEEYLQRTRDVVAHARSGDYGRIRKRDLSRIDASQKSIEKLLGGREGAIELTLEEQIELANAQEALNAIIRSDDKSRMICKQVQALGTRISTTECLTVAEREQRVEIARRNMRRADEFCIPGEGNPCSK